MPTSESERNMRRRESCAFTLIELLVLIATQLSAPVSQRWVIFQPEAASSCSAALAVSVW
jgi:hypothetical protein